MFHKMPYEYKRVFGKSDPLAKSSGFQQYDEDKMFVMHNVTDEILDGSIKNENITWCELPYDTKLRKIISYTNEQLKKGIISEKQHSMLRSELILCLSKKKLNKVHSVEYDTSKRSIINVPCLVYDNITECYNYFEKEKNIIKKSILQENISKI
jgi:hypothetical protein